MTSPVLVNSPNQNSSELNHLYGKNFHILNDVYYRSRLAWLSQPECKQPEFNQIVSELYYHLIRYVISREFPLVKTKVKTRMAELSPFGEWEGEVVDPSTKLVSVNIARAGSLPSQICFDACNFILNPDLVRQDHLFMARKTDSEGKVIGVDFSGNKVGGSVRDSIVIFPDPMGATGSSLLEAVNFYKEEAQSGTVAERTSSRLRRTNDRSVPPVISGDAEDASHVSGSYPSKRKYKLDLSSLHEDHEDDENAEIGVREQSQAKKMISLHLVISPEFIKKIKAEAPDLVVYAFRVDRGASSERAKAALPGEFLDEESGLTDIQYIVPGLGGLGELINNSYC